MYAYNGTQGEKSTAQIPQNIPIDEVVKLFAPMIEDCVEQGLKLAGISDVVKNGSGLDCKYSFKLKDGSEQTLFLSNSILEILTVDRDASPLILDKNIFDFIKFKAKVSSVIATRLTLIECVNNGMKPEDVLDALQRRGIVERCRVQRFDKKNGGNNDNA